MTPLAPLILALTLAQQPPAQQPPAPRPAPASPAPPREDGTHAGAGGGDYRAELSNAGVTLVYHVTPTDLTVAQRIRFELAVTAPPGWSVTWPAVSDKLGRATVVDTSDGRDGLKQTRTYTLEPYLPGDDTLPALSVSASPRDPQAGADPVTLTTEPVPLTIRALLPDSDPTDPSKLDPRLRDPRDLAAPPRMTPWLIGAGAAAATALIALGFVLASRKRTPPADPAAAALARIEAIAAAAPASTPQRDAALDALALAAREYLQARSVPDALGAATPELVARISRVPAIAPVAPQLTALLARVDAARFDPRHQALAPGALAAELASLLRSTIAREEAKA
jgi:hypothetical protein